MRQIFKLIGAGGFLVGLYLVLVNAAGATSILRAGAGGLNSIYKTLQGR